MRLFTHTMMYAILAIAFALGIGSPSPMLSASAGEEPAGKLAKDLAGVKFGAMPKRRDTRKGRPRATARFTSCRALPAHRQSESGDKYLEIEPAGTVLLGNGHLLVCDNKFKAILDVSPEGKVGVVADRFEGQPLRSLNDLTVDARGNVYWTDPDGSSVKNPVGDVFRVRPDGRIDRIATGLAFPNGLDVDPAGKFLYLIESSSKKILRYPIPEDRDLLGKPETFYDLGGSGGDGCVFDAAGNFWVADYHRPETGQGRITVLSPEAKVLAYLPVPAKVVSNITFGGPNLDEIYCTTGDPAGVFRAEGRRQRLSRSCGEAPEDFALSQPRTIAAACRCEDDRHDRHGCGRGETGKLEIYRRYLGQAEVADGDDR